ncbi:MAG: hypothetical protein ABEJ02_01055 [Candidatus Paceibacteria bacterium]
MEILTKVKYSLLISLISFVVVPILTFANDRSAVERINWSSFDGSETFLDFEDANLTVDSQYWDSHGVKFSTPQGQVIRINPYNRQYVGTASGKYSISADNSHPITSEDRPLVITFRQPADKIGFNLGGGEVETADITLIDRSGGVIDTLSESNITSSPTHFVGIRSDKPVKKVKIDYGNTLITEEIDNLQFRAVKKDKNNPSPNQIDLELSLSTQKDDLNKEDHIHKVQESYLDDRYGKLEFAGKVDHRLNLSVEANHDLSQNLGLIAISPSGSYPKYNKLVLLDRVISDLQNYLNSTEYETEWIGQAHHGNMEVDLSQYKGEELILAAITSNNNGHSEITGLPTEVDDIVGAYIKVKQKRQSKKIKELKPSHFSGADFTKIDFESANLNVETQYWSSHGVKFSTPQGKVISINSYNRQYKGTASGKMSIFADGKSAGSENNPLVLTFKKPINKVGFNLGNGSDTDAKITLVDEQGNNIGSVEERGIFSSVHHFVGIESDQKFKQVKIDYGNTSLGEELDNLFVPATITKSTQGSVSTDSVEFEVGVNNYKEDPSNISRLKSGWVNMFEMKQQGDKFSATFDQRKKIQYNNETGRYEAQFDVEPDKLVHFVGYRNLNNAKRHVSKFEKQLHAPLPYKVFPSKENKLCQVKRGNTNQIYHTQKGEESCTGGMTTPYHYDKKTNKSSTNKKKSTEISLQELENMGPKVADFEQLGKAGWKKSKSDLSKNAYSFMIKADGLPVITTRGNAYSRNYSLFLDGLATKTSNNIPLTLSSLSAKSVGFMLGNSSDKRISAEIRVSYESGDQVDTFTKQLEPNKNDHFFGVKSRYKLIDEVAIDYGDTSVSEEIDYLMYDDDFQPDPEKVYCITDGMGKQKEFYDEQRAWDYYLNHNSWSATLEYDQCYWTYSSKDNRKYKPFCAVTDSGKYKLSNPDQAAARVKENGGYIIQQPYRDNFCTDSFDKSNDSGDPRDVKRGKNSSGAENMNEKDEDKTSVSNPDKENQAKDVNSSCPLKSGEPYTTEGTNTVWVITERGTKRPVQSSEVYFTYFDSWDRVKTTNRSSLNKCLDDIAGFLPWGPNWNPKGGALVKIPSDDRVYLLLGNNKYWINNQTVFKKLGYKWSWIQDISPKLLQQYKSKGEIDYTDHHPPGSLVTYQDSNKVYRIEEGAFGNLTKRHIKDERVFEALGYRFDRIVEIDKSETYKTGQPITIDELNNS